MRKTKYKKIIITILSIFLFSSAFSVFATCIQTGANAGKDDVTGKICYVLLEPGAFQGVDAPSNDLGKYLGQVFDYGIAIAVVLALIMIIYGGIIKMTTDSWEKADTAKTIIENALYGLGMALISWILLYTINPELVDFKYNTFLYPPDTTETGNNTQQPCNNCVDVSEFIKCKNGCQINMFLGNKLQTAFKGVNAWMTEGYPLSTTKHSASCHFNGTCADVNLINSPGTVSEVVKLYNNLINAGLSPTYELQSGSCDAYIKAGMDKNKCIVNSKCTAQSFHVTNN